MEDAVSVAAARFSTIRLSFEPLCWMACASPATMAMTTTNTATTRAMPPPVIAFDTRLTRRLRRLYLNGIAISIHHAQSIHNLAPCGRASRDIRTHEADSDCGQNRLENHSWRNLHCSDKRPEDI